MIEIESKNLEKLDAFYRRIVDGANRSGQVCFGDFNGHLVFSTETIDQVYTKVIGRDYTEFGFYESLLKEYWHWPGYCDYIAKVFNTGSDEEWENVKGKLKGNVESLTRKLD